MPPGSGTKEEAIEYANAHGGNFDTVTGKDLDSTNKTKTKRGTDRKGHNETHTNVNISDTGGYNIASLEATAAKTAARIAADKPKIKTTIDSMLDTPTEKEEESSFTNWWKELFSPSTKEEKANEPDDPVKAALKFLANPLTSFVPKLLEQSRTGMNDEAKAEYARLANLPDNKHPTSNWNLMTEAERAFLARKPQVDNQLPHAFIDGHPTTDIQKQIADLTGGRSPGYTIYNGDGSVNIEATANTVGGGGNGDGNNGAGIDEPEVPKWWEVGQPTNTGGGTGGTGGTYDPYNLQQELSTTPDFTGSFNPNQGSQFYPPQQAYGYNNPLQAFNQTAQTSLLGNTALPSQQITGLLAPTGQQPQQGPQFNPYGFNNLLGGNS